MSRYRDDGSDGVDVGIVKCRKTTPRALLVEDEDGAQWWVPKSVVHDDSEVYEEGGEGSLVVMRWWAEKEGRP